MTGRAVVGLRATLRSSASLLPRVRGGMEAIPARDARLFEDDARRLVRQSLDLDAALAREYPNEHRWDYLVSTSDSIVGVEPHQARGSEVRDVIQKKRNAERHLLGEFRPGYRVEAWLWVTRGAVAFSRQESAFRRLSSAGIQFVGRRVTAKHLSQVV